MKKLIYILSPLLIVSINVFAESAAPKGVDAAEAAQEAVAVDTPDESAAKVYMEEALKVFQKMQANPKKRIPDEVLADTYAMLMMRVNSGAIGLGASEGKGFAVKNNFDTWSPPAFYKLSAGSLGLQIGAQTSDVIILFMNEKAADLLLKNEFQIGVGAQAEAGPAGGEVSLNTWQDADMLIYNTSKGLAVGVSIGGGKLIFDQALNDEVYDNKDITAASILGSQVIKPEEAKELTELLREYSFLNTQPEKVESGTTTTTATE